MEQNRRRRVLVNGAEVQTDAALRDAVAAAGFRLDAKVRVADAVNIERSGLSNTAYGYAMRSHFDWVVSDLKTTEVAFAIEFDGPSHAAESSRARDALKDEICRRLDLPLLRIDGAVLRPYRQRTVLAVLIEAWGLYQGFLAAQESGAMPWDEIFDPHMSLEPRIENGRLVIDQPFNLALQPAAHFNRLKRAGAIRGWRRALRADDAWDVAFAWAYLPDGEIVLGQARVRSSSFPAFASIDLADDLAYIDLSDRLHRWEEGDPAVRMTAEQVVAAGVPPNMVPWETTLGKDDLTGWGFGSG